MSDDLILDFPVLKKGGGDFLEEVSYEVEALRDQGNLKIKHILKGQSFIGQLVKDGDATFSVLLLYKNSSERQHHVCRKTNISAKDNDIVAEQTIPIKFSYAPEIMPSIVVLNEKTISVDASSGLTDFWGMGEVFKVPQHSRIALYLKLQFTSGALSHLMNIEHKETLKDGEMEVVVRESAGEGKRPVLLLCGKGVFDELQKVTKSAAEKPDTPEASMRSAMITQALCAVYAYMQNYTQQKQDAEESNEVSGVLSAHLEMLEEKTGENWENDNFNPSLAATKMQPYATEALRGEKQ